MMTHENPDISAQENYTPLNKDQIEVLFRFNRFPCMKRAVEISFRKADTDGVCATKEGPVSYQTGDALMTGTQGETWPIAADKFAATYDVVRDGIATKKAIPVQGSELVLPAEIQASWGVLRGKPGDIVVRYGEGDYGIVSRDIFEETYIRIEGEQMANKNPNTNSAHIGGDSISFNPIDFTEVGNRIIERAPTVLRQGSVQDDTFQDPSSF